MYHTCRSVQFVGVQFLKVLQEPLFFENTACSQLFTSNHLFGRSVYEVLRGSQIRRIRCSATFQAVRLMCDLRFNLHDPEIVLEEMDFVLPQV